MVLRINEAFERSKMNGKRILKKELSKKLWPESNEKARLVAMHRLTSGKMIYINPDWVMVLCEELNCDPNFIFGVE